MPAGVPPIFCINLPESTGRRARMERRLGALGLLEHTTWVEGVRAKGSLPAHLEVRREIAARGLTGGAVVLEDDALLHRDFAARLAEVLANLPDGADQVLLSHLIETGDLGLRWAGRRPEAHNLVHYRPDHLCGLGAHWTSLHWAQETLRQTEGIALEELPGIVEQALYAPDGLAAEPRLVLVEAADSTIEPTRLVFHVRGQAGLDLADFDGAETPEDRAALEARFAGRGPQRVGLCMIVRDEAEVIERCIASVRSLISSWTIVDTGSTDGTPEVIAAALEGIPGKLEHRPWRDFGTNRSELMELAAGSADYLLLLDADMVVSSAGPVPQLTADAYLLRHAGTLDYAVPRLVRGDRRWWYEGSTHEYLATEGAYSQERLDALEIEHFGDGGTRAEKFERDAALLEGDLERTPDDQRATFYLAQTRRDQGRTEEAIALYLRRAELGGWDEEVFYAAFQAGLLTANDDPAAGLPMLLDAWQRRPWRAEPAYELARICREQGWHEAAWSFARRGLEIPYPDDLLFVHRDVWDWRMRFEYAAAAYWVGEFETSVQAHDELLADPALPGWVRERVISNRGYAVDRLSEGRPATRGWSAPPATGLAALGTLAPSVRLAEVRLDVAPPWPQFNPSIAPDGDGFRMIVRTANYDLVDQTSYRMHDADGVIRTINYLVELDAELGLRSVAPLLDEGAGPQRHPFPVEGFEDCRLFCVGGRWMAVATVRDRRADGVCEQALLTLDGARIADVRVMTGPEQGRHEKNWMPLVVDDELRFVYSCGPTVVLGADVASGALRELSRADAPPGAAPLRGGSQGVPVPGGGWLFAVHEAFDAAGRRSYAHRLALIDEQLRLAAMSRPFSFAARRIEICAGMAPRGDQMVLSFGLDDRMAMLAVVETDELLGLLEPV